MFQYLHLKCQITEFFFLRLQLQYTYIILPFLYRIQFPYQEGLEDLVDVGLAVEVLPSSLLCVHHM